MSEAAFDPVQATEQVTQPEMFFPDWWGITWMTVSAPEREDSQAGLLSFYASSLNEPEPRMIHVILPEEQVESLTRAMSQYLMARPQK